MALTTIAGRNVKILNSATANAHHQLRLAVVLLASTPLVLGLVLRLHAINNSLWLDEFGTLWAVEGDLATLVLRVLEFHSQTSFYYFVVWLFRTVLGESELVLRLPSLIAGAAAGFFLYRAGAVIGGRPAAWAAALLLWFSPYAIHWSAEARPYGLAVMFAALQLWGFVSAVRTGDRASRVLFVTGGIGLFWCNYVLALFGLGLFVGYLLLPSARRCYRIRMFGTDLCLQALAVAVSTPRLLEIWSRREALELGSGHWSVILLLAGPPAACVLLAVTPNLYARLSYASQQPRERHTGFTLLLLLTALTPLLAAVMIEEMWGINILVDRYLSPAVPAWALFAGYSVAKTRFVPAAGVGLAVLLFVYAGQLRASFERLGSFSRTGQQDWRTAVARLDAELALSPGAPVLYRAGFLEEDARARGGFVSGVVFAPLRGPGATTLSRNVIPLTFRWQPAGEQEPYVAEVLQKLRKAQVFYYLSCFGGTDEGSRGFHDRLRRYLEKQLTVQVSVEEAGYGMVLLRFENLGRVQSSSEPILNTARESL